MKRFFVWIKDLFVFEKNYFVIGGWRKSLIYFFRQGHLIRHIEDRIKFRIFPKLGILPSFPTHIDLEIVSECQLRCPMCYTTYMEKNKKGIIDFELFKKIVDEIESQRVYSLRLSWRGESLLHPKFFEILKYCSGKFPEIAFLTNAELLTEKVAEALVQHGVTWVSISADGVGNVYNTIRAPAVFEETIEKVQRLKKLRDRAGARLPLIRVQSLASAALVDKETFFDSWRDIADRINIQSDEVRDFTSFNDDDFDPFYFCDRPFNRLTIGHDGRVYNCVADYDGKVIWGSVTDNTLKEIWTSAEATRVRKAFKQGKYFKEVSCCRVCSRGLKMSTEETVDISGASVQLARYIPLKPVVEESGMVARDAPLDRLTPRIRRKLSK